MSTFIVSKAGPYSYFLIFLVIFSSDCLIEANKSLSHIFLRFYQGSATTFKDAPISDAKSLVNYMNIRNKTMLYVHGYTESVDSNSVITVVTAYCNYTDYNVMAVDWRDFAGQNYVYATLSIEEVGKYIAHALNPIFNGLLQIEQFCMVTHSLGSHLGGIIGRNMEQRIPLIVALDPAGPLFELVVIRHPLCPNDAKVVLVIHTDSTVYGNIKEMGTVDFWPNGGIRIQPGCPIISVPLSKNDFCSHHRSWEFYAESVRNRTAFSAIQCSKKGEQVGEPILMGFATPLKAHGNYHLNTRSTSPFGLGLAGETCSNANKYVDDKTTHNI